jgi:hypothetical protein
MLLITFIHQTLSSGPIYGCKEGQYLQCCDIIDSDPDNDTRNIGIYCETIEWKSNGKQKDCSHFAVCCQSVDGASARNCNPVLESI